MVTIHCYFAVTTEGVSCYLERKKKAFVGKARMIFSFLVTAVTVVTVIFLKNNGEDLLFYFLSVGGGLLLLLPALLDCRSVFRKWFAGYVCGNSWAVTRCYLLLLWVVWVVVGVFGEVVGLLLLLGSWPLLVLVGGFAGLRVGSRLYVLACVRACVLNWHYLFLAHAEGTRRGGWSCFRFLGVQTRRPPTTIPFLCVGSLFWYLIMGVISTSFGQWSYQL